MCSHRTNSPFLKAAPTQRSKGGVDRRSLTVVRRGAQSPELHGAQNVAKEVCGCRCGGALVQTGVRDPHATGALRRQPDSTLPAVLVSGAPGQRFGVPSGA